MQRPAKQLLLVAVLLSLAACNRNEFVPTEPSTTPGAGDASVTILQGDTFDKGMASLALPGLSSEERVAVIPVYGT